MPDEKQLLANALNLDHGEAKRIVASSLQTPISDMNKEEELAFAHIYTCMSIKYQCGEFWQEMNEQHRNPESQTKLHAHESLSKAIDQARDAMFPTLNPYWADRN